MRIVIKVNPPSYLTTLSILVSKTSCYRVKDLTDYDLVLSNNTLNNVQLDHHRLTTFFSSSSILAVSNNSQQLHNIAQLDIVILKI